MSAPADNGRELARALIFERLDDLKDYYERERPDDPVRLTDVVLAKACVENADYAKADEPLERVMRDLSDRIDVEVGDATGTEPNAEGRWYVRVEQVRAQIARLAAEVHP